LQADLVCVQRQPPERLVRRRIKDLELLLLLRVQLLLLLLSLLFLLLELLLLLRPRLL
jgi:hypothetical protein